MKHKLFSFLLCIFSFSISNAIPPTPNEYAIETAKASDLIAEGIVKKCDTLNISDTLSYFIYTFQAEHIFKNKKGQKDSAIKVIVKRNLEWERAEFLDLHFAPQYFAINNHFVLFLKEKNGFPNKYTLTSRYKEAKFIFVDFIYAHYAAHAFELNFITLQDVYQFIKQLPETTVPASLSDFPQLRSWEKPKPIIVDSVEIKRVEEDRRKREEFQRVQLPELQKYLDIKIKRAQKKNTKRRLSKTINLNSQLANPTFVYGADYTSLVFDVLLSASENIYLDNYLLKLKYNTAAFGSYIVQNGKITVTRSAGFQTGYYYNPQLNLADQGNGDIISIPFGKQAYTASNITRNQITTIPTKFLQIEIKIANCSQSADIAFSDVSNTSNLNFYTSTNPTGYLEGVSVDVSNYSGNINPGQLCKPNIISISPTSITAGTNSKITITGFGFGDTRGNGLIVFPDANKDFYSPILGIDDVDVISWSDSKIEYIIPSNVRNQANVGACSGSGKIAIRENTSKTSDFYGTDIEIPYAIDNQVAVSGKKFPLLNAETQGTFSGKITFYCTQELFNNFPYYTLIKKAVDDLSCATSINFELSSVPLSDSYIGLNKDKLSVISLADDNIFPTQSSLMSTLRYNSQSCTKNNQTWISTSESDIIIKRSFSSNWSLTYPDQDLPTNGYDFYSAILHELGHAAGLYHIVSIDGLMKPIADKGYKGKYNRFSYQNKPFDSSILGVQWLLNEGSKYAYSSSSCSTVRTMIPKNYCGNLTNIEEINNTVNNIELKTNPISSDVAIFKLAPQYQHTNFSYEIFDIQGNKLVNGVCLSNQELELPFNNLPINLYLVIISDANNKRFSFKVLKN